MLKFHVVSPVRGPDVHRNSVDMTVLPANDWQQNADAAFCCMPVTSLRQLRVFGDTDTVPMSARTLNYAIISRVIGRFFGIKLLPDVFQTNAKKLSLPAKAKDTVSSKAVLN